MMTHVHGEPVALPVGADPNNADTWETVGGVAQRLIWSGPMPMPEHLAAHDIRVVVTQLADGTVIKTGDDGPLVYYGCDDYSPTDARQIAQALAGAADLAEHLIATVEETAGGAE